ncbi:MAG TPA: potassium/proton antiporter [Nakamurella sp.]|nr:potassium/proton antiporter [Nakamurella sp.]
MPSASTLDTFGLAIVLVSAVVLVAALSSRLSQRIRVPAPALFLVGAAVASEIFPRLRDIPAEVDERIVTVALIFILFDGGMHIGWRRFRSSAGSILWVGLAGTAVTAAAVAAVAHLVFGFDVRLALLIGAALSPTDPAVVFSVLGRREIAGRTGTILEGESGANDPVGIALMVALLGATGGGWQALGSGAAEFALQMVVGGAVGLAGGYGLLQLIKRLPLPNGALYPVRTLACAPLIYGLAALAHGSGFLAVFLAGILIGDARAPYKREIERFAGAIGSLAEIVAFTVLGLSVTLHDLIRADELWVGLALAGILILLIRPILVGLLLLPVRLRWGERIFTLWAGLKGAVPILLAMFILTAGEPDGHRVYGIVFLVVLVSVVVQGGLVPTVARLCRVPMRVVEPEPWALGMRFRDEPTGLQRYVVAPGSAADGVAIAELPLSESAWVSLVSRRGRLVQVRGTTELQAGDEVLVLMDEETDPAGVFRSPPT